MPATAHGSPRPGVECGGRPAEAASPKWPQMARPCGAAIGGGRHSNPGQWSARSGYSRVSAAGRCPSRSNGLRTATPPMRIARPASHGVGTRVPAARGPHRRAAVPVLPGRKAALRAAPPRRCGWALAACRVKLAQGRGMRLMQDAKRCPLAHNGRSRARPRAEHSPMTHDGRALWSAVQSNEVDLTPCTSLVFSGLAHGVR